MVFESVTPITSFFLEKNYNPGLHWSITGIRANYHVANGIENEMKKYDLNPFVIQHYNRTFAARLSDVKCLI